MKNIQNLIAFALLVLAMTACKKENEFVATTNAPKEKSAIPTNNHTHTTRKCASKAHMAEKLQDPIFKAAYEATKATFERNLKNRPARSRSACSNPTVLPVAIHYQGVTNSDRVCLVNMAKKAIEVLNADFQAKNSDIIQWDNNAARYYPNISKGAACMTFEIATQNHPAGFGLQNGDLAVTINKTNGDVSNEWSGYINIFVGDADGSLGYAPLGGSGNGDGVIISEAAFAIGGSCGSVRGDAPNDLGRTLTHEMGHYLNLDHLWGDGGCESDDNVADTPNQADANYECPTLGGTRGCTAEALHMNFMDYPDDACMYMFTAGQANRMESWLNSGLLANLKNNVLGEVNENGESTEEETPTDTDNTDDDTNDDSIDIDNNSDDNTGDNSDDTTDNDNDTTTSTSAMSEITIQVTLDDYGSETIFAIEDENGDLVAAYGPFEDEQAGMVITESIDLEMGFYTFVIFDDFGDGICCDFGNGNWKLSKDGVVLKKSDGYFGYWEEYDFTVGLARLNAPPHRKDKKDTAKLRLKEKPALETAYK